MEAQRRVQVQGGLRIVDAVGDFAAGLGVAGRVPGHFGVVGDEQVGRVSRGALGPLEVALHGGSVLAAHPFQAVEVQGERSASAQGFKGKPGCGRSGSEAEVNVGALAGRIANAQQVVDKLAGGTHPGFWVAVDAAANAWVRPLGHRVGRRSSDVHAPALSRQAAGKMVDQFFVAAVAVGDSARAGDINPTAKPGIQCLKALGGAVPGQQRSPIRAQFDVCVCVGGANGGFPGLELKGCNIDLVAPF